MEFFYNFAEIRRIQPYILTNMKLLLRTYFPLLLLLLFQFCISPDDVNKTIDDEEEEEEEEEEVVLEDPTDLPFTVNWSINKEGDEIGGSFSPFYMWEKPTSTYTAPTVARA